MVILPWNPAGDNIDPMLSTSAKLETIEEYIYHQLSSGIIPRLRIPTRTKDNIEFNEHEKVFKYSSGLSFRSAKSTDGANMLMRTAYVIDFIDLLYSMPVWLNLATFNLADAGITCGAAVLLVSIAREAFHQ